MSSTHSLLKASRLVHLYFGVFITPALIFFAFTGFVQTFSLHETTRGSDYKPPKILAELAQLHKKQTLVLPNRKPQGSPAADRPRDAAAPAASDSRKHADTPDRPDTHKPVDAPAPASPDAHKPADAPAPKPKNLLPMKLCFALVSIGLFTSTVTGLYMSYKFIRNKPLITATLAAGIVIPVLLTFL